MEGIGFEEDVGKGWRRKLMEEEEKGMRKNILFTLNSSSPKSIFLYNSCEDLLIFFTLVLEITSELRPKMITRSNSTLQI